MTLQRRLLLLLLVAVPLLWGAAAITAMLRARHEINEVFDTQQIRLAQQVLALVHARGGEPDRWPEVEAASVRAAGDLGEAELKDLSVAVWSADGRLRLADREGAALPHRGSASGFATLTLAGDPWRVYYLHAPDRGWTVAVGQASEERDEVLQALLLGQLVPWLLMLPVLLLGMALVVRHALKPLRTLAADLAVRGADDLHTLPASGLPAEVAPLVEAMNRLFDKIRRTLEHERRLTADAAHELRTPLAALRAQWDASRLAAPGPARDDATRRVGDGIQRLERMVTQLLALSGVESRPDIVFTEPVDWQRVVQDALSDVLPVLEASGGDVDVEWPAAGAAPLPLAGDAGLLTLLVRNLVDNALRYGARRVLLQFDTDAMTVEDDGPGVTPEVLARLGDRFYRPAGQAAAGSGLGLSIVDRIARLHGLVVRYAPGGGERPGLRVTVSRA